MSGQLDAKRLVELLNI